MKYYATTVVMLMAAAFTAAAQNTGIGVTAPLAKLHVNGDVKIDSAYVLELGGRLTKEVNAGKIGYGVFTPGVLDIVGAGTTSTNRKIKFFNEGGATFAGGIHLLSGEITQGTTGVGNNLLPVGIAGIQALGTKQYGTSNISTSWVTDHYVIEMGAGVQGMQAFITVNSGSNLSATVINGTATAFWVYIWNSTNTRVQSGFNIVVFRP